MTTIKENTVSTAAAEYVGNELFAVNGDATIPDGWVLPPTLVLRSAHCRGNRGVYLGRSWYLQAPGTDGPANTIDLIHFPEIYNDENLEAATAFLRAHGYRCVDDFNGEFRK